MEILKEYDVIYSNFSDNLPEGLKDKHLILCRENYQYQWGENVEETMESASTLEEAIAKMELYQSFLQDNVTYMPWLHAEINAYNAFLSKLRFIKSHKESSLKWRKEHPGRIKKHVRKHAREYYERHREEIIKVASDWYYAHRDEAMKRDKKWQAENKERVDAYQARYRKKNAKKRAAKAREKYWETHTPYEPLPGTYYERHREEILAKAKERYREKKAEMEKSKNKEK